jgi:ribosomal protein S18 acetylase RimI-like enzyme
MAVLKTAVRIRRYSNHDRAVIERMFENFQDYLASVDDIRRLVRKNALRRLDYGRAYLNKTLKDISENNGVFYVAENSRGIVGFVAARMVKQDKIDAIEIGRKESIGEITELYVTQSQRGKGTAQKLMSIAEKYLNDKGCTHMKLNVFAPNMRARRFYQKLGYTERMLELGKYNLTK